MTVEEPLVFSQTFEGLFDKALRNRMTPGLRDGLRALGVDVHALKPAYPVPTWTAAIELAAREIYPQLSTEAATWKLGEDFIQGYAETFIGRAMFGVLKVIGPKKALARMGRNFRSGNNYLETRFTENGPTDVELWFSEVHRQPGFNGGIVLGGGRLIGAQQMKIEVVRTDGREAVYRITWKE